MKSIPAKLHPSVLRDKEELLQKSENFGYPFLEINIKPRKVSKPLIRSISNPI
jgi:hypothetical protein